MIRSLGIRNFKPFGDYPTVVDVGLITLLIGENGAGKSSLLQSLALLSQSCGSSALRSGSFRFTSFGDLIHNGETAREMAISFAGSALYGPGEPGHKISFQYEASFKDPGNLATQVGVIQGIGAVLGPELDSIRGEFRHGDAVATPTRVGDDSANIEIGVSGEICKPLMRVGGSSRPDGRDRYTSLSDSLNRLSGTFRDCLGRVSIDWAGRGFDAQSYTLQKEPSPSPATGEEVFSTFAYRRELEKKVSEWLMRITGTGMSVHIAPGHQVQIRNSEGFDIYHGGFGANQLIRPLLRIAASPSDSLVAIEEAEASLHPRAQVNLCDTLLDIAREEKKQILLSTHSEHILTGFLNLVAEEKLTPEELKVWYFSNKGGEAKTTLLRADERGALAGGLKGFFEVGLASYERRIKALGHLSRR